MGQPGAASGTGEVCVAPLWPNLGGALPCFRHSVFTLGLHARVLASALNLADDTQASEPPCRLLGLPHRTLLILARKRAKSLLQLGEQLWITQ